MQFEGQTVFVTGANRGLGAQLVGAALEAGAAKIWAGAREPAGVTAEVRAEKRIVPIRIDITDPASVEAAADQASDTTVLVNNAGTLGFGGPLDGDLEAFQADILTNYLGTLRVTRAFAPHLERNAPAVIVNVLTVTALAPIRALAGYSAAKAASHSMTLALRAELKGRGVEVIGAYPGGIDTEMVAAIDMMKSPPETVAAQIIEGVQAGGTVLWPDPVSAGAGQMYLENPSALEAMMAAI